jgi:hypothetical protein
VTKPFAAAGHRSRVTRRVLLPALAAVAVIYAASIAIACSGWTEDRRIASAVAFDLTASAAIAFWWLAVRPGHARPRTVWRVAAIGFVVAKLLVGFAALGAAGVAAEVVVLAALAVRVRRVARRARAERRAGHGVSFALASGLGEVVARPVAHVLAVELSAVTLAVTGWFRRSPAGVSMHRRTGYLVMVGALCALAAVEAVGMHVVLSTMAPTAAVVSSVLSGYGLLWLLGQLHAVRLQPLRVVDGALVVERGLIARAAVPVADIVAIAAVDVRPPGADVADLSMLGPNLLVELRAPIEVTGMFGRVRHAQCLALSVDDPHALRELVGLAAATT